MSKSEIQARLKSSIEEKLCSLGAYVDKELPEYILVMIANKKNKEMMEKDLQLFLGQDTTVFIDWLHDLLGKSPDNLEKVLHTGKSVDSNDHIDRSSQERRKKKDKIKVKKIRKCDDKKMDRKSSVIKIHRSRSRSASLKKSKVSEGSDSKKLLVHTPDKSIKKVNLDPKRDAQKTMEASVVVEKPSISSTVYVADRPTNNVENVKSSATIVQRQSIETAPKLPEKPQQSILSTVKVTKRPNNTSDILKPSITMIQRDIKESVSNHPIKRDDTHEKPSEQRSSVFSRLGNNDLRVSRLSQKRSPERQKRSEEKHILKRAIQDIDKPDENDIDDCTNAWYSHSKVKKMDSEEKPVSTSFIVTLKGAEKLNLPLKSRLGPKKNIEDVIIMSTNSDMDDIDDDLPTKIDNQSDIEVTQDTTENIAPVIVTGQAASRCKFWPLCKNKDNCPFFHPHELCTNFPNCKFGSSCLYMHPNCRFEPNCTKIDCAYTHRQPRLATTMKQLTAPGLQTRCLYYPKCTNVNCKYFHPNLPCKFGAMCMAKDTCMFYHPSIPDVTELKWVASDHDPALLTKSRTATAAAIVAEAQSVKL